VSIDIHYSYLFHFKISAYFLLPLVLSLDIFNDKSDKVKNGAHNVTRKVQYAFMKMNSKVYAVNGTATKQYLKTKTTILKTESQDISRTTTLVLAPYRSVQSGHVIQYATIMKHAKHNQIINSSTADL